MGLTPKQYLACGLQADDVVKLEQHIGLVPTRVVFHNIFKVLIYNQHLKDFTHVGWLFTEPKPKLHLVANFAFAEGVRKACELLIDPPGPVLPHDPIVYPEGVDPLIYPNEKGEYVLPDDDDDNTETEEE